MKPSGNQFDLRHGDYAATITAVGGGLRQLSYQDRPLVVGYDADEIRPVYRGAVLVPWPNRIADGRYSFDGRSHVLPLTEPARGNAIHGLVAWVRFEPIEHRTDQVTLAHRLVPQSGYPFALDIRVSYTLGDDGLVWGISAQNIGDRPAPYGCAAHPYLRAGSGHVDDWTFEFSAAKFLSVTADRELPVALKSVQGTAYDFSAGKAIGGTVVDHAFTEFDSGPDGRARARVRAADGHGVAMSWNPATCPWLQVYTSDLPGEDRHRTALALEPMTCPPDAFNSGADLVTLAPGERHSAAWTISAL